MPDRKPTMPAPARERRLVLLAVGALGVSCVMTQLALMREMLGAFSGNEMVLGMVLGNWLLLMGIGAWLGRTSDKLQNPLAVLVAAQILVAVLPLAQVFLLRALRNVVFVRGAEVGVMKPSSALSSCCCPFCLVAGYALTLACSLLAREARARSGIGQCLCRRQHRQHRRRRSFQLRAGPVPRPCRHSGLSRRLEPAGGRARLAFAPDTNCLSALAGALAVAVMAAAVLVDLDAVSTALQYPRQHIVARANSPYGKLVVTESAGQFDFIENGVPLISTHDTSRSRKPSITRWRSGPRPAGCCSWAAASRARRGKFSSTTSPRWTTWNLIR